MAGKKDAAWWRAYRAEKKQELARLATPPTQTRVDRPLDTVDTSTIAARSSSADPPPVEVAVLRRPSFLAAPDDDCGVCGHDKQNWHLGPTCTMGVLRGGRRSFCGCPAFVDAAEPF